MRVLQVSHSAQPGGSNGVLLSLLRHRPADVACACVFLEDGPALEAVRALGVEARLVPAGRARQAWRVAPTVWRLVRAIRAGHADIVLSHVSKAHLTAAPAARLAAVPEVWWQHEHLGLKPGMQRLAGRLRAATVICDTPELAREQATAFPRTPAVCLPLGPEVDGLGPPRVHTAGAGDAVVLGVVGRLQRWKRVELALRAMPAVLAAVPGARLRVVGDASPGLDEDYPGELRREAERLGIASAVDFAGHLPDAARRMAELDVLVHTAHREPFGLAIVEAMLRGVPAVAADEGGPRHIVRDGVDGLLVDPTDGGRLAQAIVALAGDPGRRNTLGAAARERALECFTAPRMAAETWALLRRVAG